MRNVVAFKRFKGLTDSDAWELMFIYMLL